MATSGTDRMARESPFWKAGRGKCGTRRSPLARPPGLALIDVAGAGFNVVPPTAVAFGELAGTPTVLGLPFRQVLAVSPEALNTVIPGGRRGLQEASMLWAVAAATGPRTRSSYC